MYHWLHILVVLPNVPESTAMSQGISEFPMPLPDRAADMPPVSREDVLRARDRRSVLDARARKRAFRLLWLLAGPGVLVMLG